MPSPFILKHRPLTALLTGCIMLEMSIMGTMQEGMWDAIGWMGGNLEWTIFCMYLLPSLLMAPVALWADAQVGRERMMVWGLGLLGGSMLATHWVPGLGAMVFALGHAMFLPSAFLALVKLLTQRDERMDLGFTLTMVAIWTAPMLVRPLLLELGGGFLARLLEMFLLVGLGLVLWMNRTGLRAGEPPVVPKQMGNKSFQGIQILYAGGVAWGLWIVMQVVTVFLEGGQTVNWFMMGLVTVAMLLFLWQGKKGQKAWFLMAAMFFFLYTMLQANSFSFIASDGSVLAMDFYYLEWDLFWQHHLPFSLGMGLVVAGLYLMPERMRGQASLLVRLLVGSLMVGLLVAVGWATFSFQPPYWLMMFILGFASTLVFPLGMMLIWQQASTKLKTASIGLGLLISNFGHSTWEIWTDQYPLESIFDVPFVYTINGWLMLAVLFMAGLMLLLWLRKKKV